MGVKSEKSGKVQGHKKVPPCTVAATLELLWELDVFTQRIQQTQMEQPVLLLGRLTLESLRALSAGMRPLASRVALRSDTVPCRIAHRTLQGHLGVRLAASSRPYLIVDVVALLFAYRRQ
jgi:hypothetical protein